MTEQQNPNIIPFENVWIVIDKSTGDTHNEIFLCKEDADKLLNECIKARDEGIWIEDSEPEVITLKQIESIAIDLVVNFREGCENDIEEKPIES